jgi:hypothetical protein
MSVNYDREKWKRFKDGIDNLFDGFEEDLQVVGEIARDEIVRATLAGIGENDEPFAPYSAKYRELIESVGGKPGGVVNLRGVFYHGGREPKKVSARMRRMGAGRRAFVWVNAGGTRFLARTKLTRPQKGLTDAESEMSVDLISVKVQEKSQSVRIVYVPRREKYMIFHQETRKWFTLNRANVRGAIVEAMRRLLEARIFAFQREMQ